MSMFDDIKLTKDERAQADAWRLALSGGTGEDQAVLKNLEADQRVADQDVREGFVKAAAKAYNADRKARKAADQARSEGNARKGGPPADSFRPERLLSFVTYGKLRRKLIDDKRRSARPPGDKGPPWLPTPSQICAGTPIPRGRMTPVDLGDKWVNTLWVTPVEGIDATWDVMEIRDRLGLCGGFEPNDVVVQLVLAYDRAHEQAIPTVCDAGGSPAFQPARRGAQTGWTRDLRDSSRGVRELVVKGPQPTELAEDPRGATSNPQIPSVAHNPRAETPDGYLREKLT